MDKTILHLKTMNAHSAAMAFFIICFSAKIGHIAHQWKNVHANNQHVYGSYEALQGGVGKKIRNRFIPTIFGDQRMQLIEQ